ncbi:SLAM family member 5-like isoform X2 [Mixophyes fleayi]|uniref:SLAM family member 5-like isoform X2 n=1 Tax=Mixophyes fleayi TaxID=3061075 RepID=UPI003F4DAFCC
MMSLFFRIILFLSLQKSVFCYDSCGEIQNITGVEGQDAILQVNQEGVTEISWVFDDIHIATTKPEGAIVVKHRHLKTRLFNETNGSLRIAKLNMADNGTYVASVFHKDEKDCRQQYRLMVYSTFSAKDIKIHHKTILSETCVITLTCTVDKPGVMVTWNNSKTNDIRLTPTVHLNYTNTNLTWTCTAANRGKSVSRSIIPWTICQKESEGGKTLTVICAAVVVAVILLIVLPVSCIWLRKTIWKTKGNSREQLHDKNFYCEIGPRGNESSSAEVQEKMENVTKTKNQNINTTYITLSNKPTKPTHKKTDLDKVYCMITL